LTTVRTFGAETSGTTAVEFAIIAPVFVAFVFGILQGGLMLWTQSGLQHASEMAARCASVNSTLCGTPANVQAYATSQTMGRTLPASAFTLTKLTPPGCGNQVTGSYGVQLFTYPITLRATACFPLPLP
jgi:Flp pilus assembly protein TadG